MKPTTKIIFEKQGQKFEAWLLDDNGRILDCEPNCKDRFYIGLFINNLSTLVVGGFIEMGTSFTLPYRIKQIIKL